ncbi:hypothetical protein EH221_04520 [bacterium]|nr:MAG: hypothetical protein EH221_04520 [bacterium]
MTKKNTKIKGIFTILLVVFCALVAWAHFFHLDGAFDFILGVLSFEDTLYAPGYSNAGFKCVHEGTTRERVLELIGYPIYKSLIYCTAENNLEGSYDYRKLYIIAHSVTDIIKGNSRGSGNDITKCADGYSEDKFGSIKLGQSEYEVMKILGEPLEEIWGYSKSPNSTDYRIRLISIKNGKVTSKLHKLYYD